MNLKGQVNYMQKRIIKEKFQFELGIIYKSINVLGDDVYCFDIDDHDKSSIYKIFKAFKKLGYQYNSKRKRPYYRPLFIKGVSINQNSKEFWFYNSDFGIERIVNTHDDYWQRESLEHELWRNQPELLTDDITYFVKDKVSNKLPDYVLNYKVSLFERILDRSVYYLEEYCIIP